METPLSKSLSNDWVSKNYLMPCFCFYGASASVDWKGQFVFTGCIFVRCEVEILFTRVWSISSSRYTQVMWKTSVLSRKPESWCQHACGNFNNTLQPWTNWRLVIRPFSLGYTPLNYLLVHFVLTLISDQKKAPKVINHLNPTHPLHLKLGRQCPLCVLYLFRGQPATIWFKCMWASSLPEGIIDYSDK